MRFGLKVRHIVSLGVLSSLFFFQNCSSYDENSTGVTGFSSHIQQLPFAYKASLDTISYMSCSRMKSDYEKRAYFTFRAGAYTPSYGLSMNKDYLEETKYYSLESKANALSSNPKNTNTRLQLALRNTNNLQSIVVNGSPSNGTSLGTMLSSLSASPIVDHLVTMQAGDVKHYFPSDSDDRLMASSLRFNDGSEENVVGEIRKMLRDRQALLALTFTDTDNPDDKTARGPTTVTGDSTSTSSASNDVYGTGYQIQFKSPMNWATAEQRVLSTVNEVNLSSGFPSTGGSWSCPSSMQFVVVRNEDLATVSNCEVTVDYYTNDTQRLALDAIRRVLPVEDFYVDVVHQCIVAKNHIANQSCYGDRTGRGAIDYSSGSCSGDSCPHYVSVCVKTK
ncbi:MAG: hypothetical protein CL676_05870 [Bdellovibrionaceae bacterium]|nr:hypothetical protein [Pseudobdellovibrionaceae bacterium]|tara:strand:+ start:1813 stop:2988 length:1176 start_codon:yes stop_codon:yes gene_type:complete